jgi:hypothetical protein
MHSQASLRAFTRDRFFSDEHLARECGANAAVKGLLQPRFWVRTSCAPRTVEMVSSRIMSVSSLAECALHHQQRDWLAM